MKSLVIFISLLAATYGSLSTGSTGILKTPAIQIPLSSGQYRVESSNADGSVSGQYGYKTESQHVQVSYDTAGQTQVTNNDQTAPSGTTAEAPTTTDSKIEDTTTQDDTKTTATVLTTVPLQTVNTPVVQTYGAQYPTNQLPSFYYHVKPVPSGFYPNEQQFSYSQSVPYLSATGQSSTGYYFPNYISGQQYLNPQYVYQVASSNIGTSAVVTDQVRPQVYTPVVTGQVRPQVYTPVVTGQVRPQVYTPSVTGQVPTPVTSVYQAGSTPVIAGQSGAGTYTGQSGTTIYTRQGVGATYTGQAGIAPVVQTPVATHATGQFYSGQQGSLGISSVTPSIQRGTLGTYSSRYGHVVPTFSHRTYYPFYSHHGFAQRYGYPRIQYRVNRI